MAAGAVAGALQVVVTCPMEMVKIRLQTQAMLPKHLQSTAGEVLRELGLRGLYRGAAATLMRDIPFSIIFFPGEIYVWADYGHGHEHRSQVMRMQKSSSLRTKDKTVSRVKHLSGRCF
jgi:hypothetical protein